MWQPLKEKETGSPVNAPSWAHQGSMALKVRRERDATGRLLAVSGRASEEPPRGRPACALRQATVIAMLSRPLGTTIESSKCGTIPWAPCIPGAHEINPRSLASAITRIDHLRRGEAWRPYWGSPRGRAHAKHRRAWRGSSTPTSRAVPDRPSSPARVSGRHLLRPADRHLHITRDRRASDIGDLVHGDNPAVPASMTAECRRPRSLSFEPNSRHLCRIDSR